MYKGFIRSLSLAYLERLDFHPVVKQSYRLFKRLSFSGDFRALHPNIQKAILWANPLIVLRVEKEEANQRKITRSSDDFVETEDYIIGGFQYLTYFDEQEVLDGQGYKFVPVCVITSDLNKKEIQQISLGSALNHISLQLCREKGFGQLFLDMQKQEELFGLHPFSKPAMGKWFSVSAQTIQRQVNKIKKNGGAK